MLNIQSNTLWQQSGLRLSLPEPSGRSPAPDGWRSGLLAGLPHLLVLVLTGLVAFAGSLGIQIPRIQTSGSAYIFATDLLILLAALILTLFAWRRGWPRWSGSLYGYLFLISYGLLGVPIQIMSERLNKFDFQGIYILWLLPVATALFLLLLARKDPYKALLAVIPLMPILWMPTLEFVPPELRIPVQSAGFLLAALAAVMLVRWGSWKVAPWLVLGLNAAVGLAFSLARASIDPVIGSFPARAVYVPIQPAEVIFLWLPGLAALSTLIFTPPLMVALAGLGRRLGRPGRWLAALSIAGILLQMAAIFGLCWRYMAVRPGLLDPARASLGVLIFVSFGLAVLGLVALFILAAAHSETTAWLPPFLLGLALLSVPVIAPAPILYNFSVIPRGVPLPGIDLNVIPQNLVFGLAVGAAILGVYVSSSLRRLHASLPEPLEPGSSG